MTNIALLPPDVVDLISNQLTETERWHCALVCHDWYRQFGPWLFRTLRIRNGSRLDHLLTTLNKSHDLQQPIGPIVKTLNIQRKEITQDELHDLRDLCCNVTRLRAFGVPGRNIQKKSSSPQRTNTPVVCSFLQAFGRSITHLTIGDQTFISESSVRVLVRLPWLRTLDLCINSLSISEIEFMRVSLPQLETLSLYGDGLILGPVRQKGGAPGGLALKTLLLRFDFGWSQYALWLHYATSAFPNVKTIDYQSTSPNPIIGSGNTEVKEQRLAYFNAFATGCQHLSAIRFTDINVDPLLFHILARHGVRLSEIAVNSSYCPRESQKDLLDAMILYTQPPFTLHALSFYIFPESRFSTKIPTQLLRMTINDATGFDSLQRILAILDFCPELEELTLICTHLQRVPAKPMTMPKHKQLSKLTLHNSSLSSEALSCIRARFPNLQHLEIIA